MSQDIIKNTVETNSEYLNKKAHCLWPRIPIAHSTHFVLLPGDQCMQSILGI